MANKTVRSIRCVVSKDKMNKSRVGESVRLVRHPLVGKYIKKTTRIMFHDENNDTQIGDEVLVFATRPRSAHKSHELLSIVRKAASAPQETVKS
ncbi:MAG: uS17 family ribosomal protein [Proteobacteria bacterium]|nr:uS17 family ribosomal protein [Pseudomonadota bacterium]